MMQRPSFPSASSPDDDDRIDRLYDIPESQWDMERWRLLALYLAEDYQAVVGDLRQVTDLLAQSVKRNEEYSSEIKRLHALSDARQTNRLLSLKPPKGKAGAPKRLTESQERQRFEDLLTLHSRQKRPGELAERLSRRLGLSKHTWQNRISKVKTLARKQILSQYEPAEAAALLKHFKLD